MAEKLKWRSKKTDVIKKSKELKPSERENFHFAMDKFGIASTQVCDELGVEVTKGQEWRVEKNIYIRKK